MNWWKELAILFLGAILGIVLWDKTSKEKVLNKITNNTKIKNNKAPIKDISVETNIIAPKEKKKRFRLFKKRKKKIYK